MLEAGARLLSEPQSRGASRLSPPKENGPFDDEIISLDNLDMFSNSINLDDFN